VRQIRLCWVGHELTTARQRWSYGGRKLTRRRGYLLGGDLGIATALTFGRIGNRSQRTDDENSRQLQRGGRQCSAMELALPASQPTLNPPRMAADPDFDLKQELKRTWSEMAAQDEPLQPDPDDSWRGYPTVTPRQKKVLHEMLMNRVYVRLMENEAKMGDGKLQDVIEELAGWKTLQRLVKDQHELLKPSDLVWAWVASVQDAMAHPDYEYCHSRRIRLEWRKLYRPGAGPERNEKVCWRELAETTTGWRTVYRECTDPEDFAAMVESRAIQVAINKLGYKRQWDRGPYNLVDWQVRRLWGSVKTRAHFQGEGGWYRFWVSLGLLVVEHNVVLQEMHLEEMSWWKHTERIALAIGLMELKKEARVPLGGSLDNPALNIGRHPELGVRVVVDLMAGSQSLRLPTEECGFLYYPLDIRRYVYSPVEEEIVKNAPLDILLDTPEQIHDQLVQWVASMVGEDVHWTLIWVWASPDCTTFSRMNQINLGRGHAYRDHSDPEKPPMWAGNYGKARIADQHDNMVRAVQGLMNYWMALYPKVKVALENPVGDLQCRPYMQDWLQKYRIDYCVWGHRYQKETNIWTNLEWEPEGTTGTGLCRQGNRCDMGGIHKTTGVFQHDNKLGQASQDMVGGRGRTSYKASVPLELHRELLTCVMGTWLTKVKVPATPATLAAVESWEKKEPEGLKYLD
jgi:hypothetical protein